MSATKPTMITVTMTLPVARRRAAALADLLCWARGYRAALGSDDRDVVPEGLSETREMKHALDRAIAPFDEEDMPF